MARRPLTSKQRAIGSQRRANLATIKARQESAQAVQASQSEQILARRTTVQRAQRSSKIRGVVSEQAVSTATPSSDSGLVMITIFTMAGLIIVYQLVTRGPALTGFLGGASNWVHTLSTNTPLFKTVAK